MRIRITSGLLVLLAAAQIGITASPTAAREACVADSMEDVGEVDITLTSERRTYRIGDTATIHVAVTRDLGDTSQPAEGYDVLVGLKHRRVNLYGSGVTNDQGIATVDVRIARYARPGLADVRASATKEYGVPPCLAHRDSHFVSMTDFLLIRRAR